MPDRFRIGRMLRSPLSSELRIFNRFLLVSTVAVMMGELSIVLRQPAAEQGLDRLRRAFVNCLPPLDEQRAVSHFLREGVLEGVFDLRVERLLVDELRSGELREGGRKRGLGQVHDSLQDCLAELLADYRRGLEN